MHTPSHAHPTRCRQLPRPQNSQDSEPADDGLELPATAEEAFARKPRVGTMNGPLHGADLQCCLQMHSTTLDETHLIFFFLSSVPGDDRSVRSTSSSSDTMVVRAPPAPAAGTRAPEPTVVRAPPAQRAPDSRSREPRTVEPKAPEPRAPEPKAPEPRAPEPRGAATHTFQARDAPAQSMASPAEPAHPQVSQASVGSAVPASAVSMSMSGKKATWNRTDRTVIPSARDKPLDLNAAEFLPVRRSGKKRL